MPVMSRRTYLKTTAGFAAATLLPTGAGARDMAVKSLVADTRTIEVNGRAAKVFALRQPGGASGLVLDPGERFRVNLRNALDVPTLVHWHGQIPPNNQDGVPGVTGPAIPAGGEASYDFKPRPGTYWMHSHFGLQRQKLFSVPLIVRTKEDTRADLQDVTVLLHDFTFHDPEQILAGLHQGGKHKHGAGGKEMVGQPVSPGVTMHKHGNGERHAHLSTTPAANAPMNMPMNMDAPKPGGMMMGGMTMDLNDVEFDAYLANDRTLGDPEVIRAERGGRIRLRLINAAAATNFLIDIGALHGIVVAVDGNPVVPMPVKGLMPLAMAQRMDVVVQLPAAGGAWPVLALREGGRERTGVVLATRQARIHKIADKGQGTAAALGNGLDFALHAATPLPPRPAGHKIDLRLTGRMMPYGWQINGKKWGNHDPIPLTGGERVVVTFDNRSMMSHPMHLHGHHFQVTAVNGNRIAGPMRDTVLVPARGTVEIAFDAGTSGRWVAHCHNAYHMAAGMMTEFRI